MKYNKKSSMRNMRQVCRVYQLSSYHRMHLVIFNILDFIDYSCSLKLTAESTYRPVCSVSSCHCTHSIK